MFDSYGAFDRLICETSKDMVDEAELEEAMLSALKKKFVPKRNETYKSAFNSFLHMLGVSKIKNQNELQLENSQLESLTDGNLLEDKMALVLRNQNRIMHIFFFVVKLKVNKTNDKVFFNNLSEIEI